MTKASTKGGFRLRIAATTARVAPRLEAEQQLVVRHRGGPLLVLAGPGTGKTTTLVEAVATRILEGEAPSRILVLTFSRRAAAELRERIGLRLGGAVQTPRAMTFHSFCLSLLRRFSPELAGGVPRLLTAGEQDFRVRELLAGELGDEWPKAFGEAKGTRGFAEEVSTATTRATQLGLGPRELAALAAEAGRPEWAAVANFFERYLDVMEWEGVIDYSELVHRARRLLADPGIGERLRAELGSIFVDEYQDTDPAQVALLHELVPPGGDLMVVGDPDQAIYEFRGAKVRGILDFCQEFPQPDGSPAPVIALGQTHRFGPELAAASRGLAERLPVPRGVAEEVRLTWRRPRPSADVGTGGVEVLEFDDSGAEAEHIADLLRRSHLLDGFPYEDMAVIVRSGRRALPQLARALVAAGVPIRLAGDEVALASEPAVQTLLLALTVAARGGRPDADEAAQLLLSPLGGLDSVGLRRLGRALLSQLRSRSPGSPKGAAELVSDCLAEVGKLAALPASPEAAAAAALGALLSAAAAAILDGSTAREALWLLWSATSWPARLATASAVGGVEGGRADADLDAVVALFDQAARWDEVPGRRGLGGFLSEIAGQQLPSDSRLEEAPGARGVRLLTAHRSKGLEWPLVVVAGVQEGVWPDLRRRGTLLEPDRLDVTGLGELPPASVLLAGERRLFYVACTRARSRLFVTTVAGVDGEGDQPSRFLQELGVGRRRVTGRPSRPHTLTALVGELRRVAADPLQDPRLREAAALRLARLAETQVSGRQVAPAANPARWWGLRPLSKAEARAADGPIRLSGSELESLLTCPRQFFLNRRVKAGQSRNPAAALGSLVHKLAEHATLTGTPPVDLAENLDLVWDRLGFDVVWLSDAERLQAESSLERLGVWQLSNDRKVLGAEVRFRVNVSAGGREFELSGSVDRLEQEADGRLRIVDFKTGGSVPTKSQALGNDQLGVYQLAARQGGFADLAGTETRLSGGELVYLRVAEGKGKPGPKVLTQQSLDSAPYLDVEPPVAALSPQQREQVGSQREHETWVHHRLAAAATLIETDTYVATPGPACSWCGFATSCPARPEGRQVVS